jgi:glutaredoxin-like protein
MSLLRDEDRIALTEEFGKLDQPVKVLVFTQEMECQYCRETRSLAEEISELSDSIAIEIYDFVADEAVVQQYGIDKIPAIAIVKDGDDAKDYGIRYFGIPSGYEFSSLITDIIMVSSGDSGLSAETKEWVANLDNPIHLQVFVTPTCPYCPPAVILAHRLAMESDMIKADMVEAIEFPGLSNKYQVQGVPRTIINETVHMEGAAPEPMLLAKLQEAAQINAG